MEPFTKWQAWVDLLLLANHDTGCVDKRGVEVKVRRGQTAIGEIKLADRWKWSRGKVRRFLSSLENSRQIRRVFASKNGTEDSTEDGQKSASVKLLIEIVNYNQYQDGPNEKKRKTLKNSTEDSTEDGTRTRRIKNEKKKKEEKELYMEDVRLTKSQHEKLVNEKGAEWVNQAIQVLNNYKMSTGKKYKSDYHAIRGWVTKRITEDKQNGTNQGSPKGDKYCRSDDRPWSDGKVYGPDDGN